MYSFKDVDFAAAVADAVANRECSLSDYRQCGTCEDAFHLGDAGWCERAGVCDACGDLEQGVIALQEKWGRL